MPIIIDRLHALWAWTAAHPEAWGYIWPIISALIVLLLKPKSPEQYAAIAARSPTWFWSRWAAAMQLVGSLGLDPVKATKIVQKILAGRVDDPPPPKGPSVDTETMGPPSSSASRLPRIGLVLAAVLTLSGCAWWDKHADTVVDILTTKSLCAIRNQDLEWNQIVARCALTSEDVPKILELVSASRERVASARYDEQTKAAAKSCAPEGK